MYKSYYPTILGALGIMVGACYFTGAQIAIFLNVISFGITILIPLCLSLSSYSPAEIAENISLAFSRQEIQENRYQKALIFFTSLYHYFICSGLIGILIGLVAMLTKIGDKRMIGVGLSVALLTILYAVVCIALFVVPFTTALRKKIADMRGKEHV